MIINVTQDSLESVIEAGLAVLGDKTKLPAVQIPELAKFILNYYSPDVSEFLSAQFIGESR